LKCIHTRRPQQFMINRVRKSFVSAMECMHGGKVQEAAERLGAEPLDFFCQHKSPGLASPGGARNGRAEAYRHYPDNSYPGFLSCSGPVHGCGEGVHRSRKRLLRADQALRGGGAEEGDLALIPTPTFGEYENQSHLAGARVEKLQIDQSGLPVFRDSDLARARLLFVCNPNNPTGRLLSRDQVISLADRCEEAEVFLLVDEAFIELSDPHQSVAILHQKGISCLS